MRLSSCSSFLAVLALALAATSGQTIPNRYIVEFHERDNGVHKRFMENVLPIEVRHQFDHEVFTGMSFDVKDSWLTYEALKKLPQVKNIWPISNIAKRDTSYSIKNSPAWNPHAETGVQELHDRNITGAGVVVGVIDSGVDVNHPALKGKILSSVNLANSTTPLNSTEDCEGHGTLCSSIIVGDTPELLGVAPGAKIRSYQVGDCHMKSEEGLIRGLLEALKDGVDVISCSMGDHAPYALSPLAEVAARVATKIPVIVSANNDGIDGPYSANKMGSVGDVIAVAMTVTRQLMTYNATLFSTSGNNLTFRYLDTQAVAPRVNGTFFVQFVNSICNIKKANTTLSETVVFGMGGNCLLDAIFLNLDEVGYMGAMVLQDPTELNYLGSEIPKNSKMKVLGSASSELFAWISDEISNNSTVKMYVNLDQAYETIPRKSSIAGAISEHSSWGPTFEQGFMPHITAPGGNYLVANPHQIYYEASGTSFACPYIAGVVALYLSAHKNVSVKEIRNRLLAATNLLPQSIEVSVNGNDVYNAATYDNSTIAPLIQQGTGFIDAVQLFEKKTLILSEPYFSLNDTRHRVSTFTVTFQNGDSNEVTYNISNKGFDTVYTRNQNWTIPEYYPPVVQLGPTASFILKTTIVLKPGKTASFNVTIKPPQDVDSYFAPVFEGAIFIEGSNNDTVRVPYIGSQFDAYQWLPWSEEPMLFVNSTEGELVPLEKIKNTVSITPLEIDSLVLKSFIRFGTSFRAFYLVKHDFKLSSFSPSVFITMDGHEGLLTLNTPDGGQVPALFPFKEPGELIASIANVGNSSDISPGRYRVLAFALRPLGDELLSSDYQLKLSKDFKILESNDNSTNNQNESQPTKLSGAWRVSFNSWLITMPLTFWVLTML